MADWTLSAHGQSVVDVASATLSLGAILLALFVALVEQRRFHAERRRELRREQEAEERRQRETAAAQAKFLRLAIALVAQAEEQLSQELRRIADRGHPFIEWNEAVSVPHLMIPFRDSLRALQVVPQEDPEVVITLSRAIRSLQELIKGLHHTAPSIELALGHCTPRLADLERRRNQLVEKLGAVESAFAAPSSSTSETA